MPVIPSTFVVSKSSIALIDYRLGVIALAVEENSAAQESLDLCAVSLTGKLIFFTLEPSRIDVFPCQPVARDLFLSRLFSYREHPFRFLTASCSLRRCIWVCEFFSAMSVTSAACVLFLFKFSVCLGFLRFEFTPRHLVHS